MQPAFGARSGSVQLRRSVGPLSMFFKPCGRLVPGNESQRPVAGLTEAQVKSALPGFPIVSVKLKLPFAPSNKPRLPHSASRPTWPERVQRDTFWMALRMHELLQVAMIALVWAAVGGVFKMIGTLTLVFLVKVEPSQCGSQATL